jgi:hypothetical protein
MSQLGHERRPFKRRLLDDFRYAPGSDRGRVAAQYVAKGQQETHAPQQKLGSIRSPRCRLAFRRAAKVAREFSSSSVNASGGTAQGLLAR